MTLLDKWNDLDPEDRYEIIKPMFAEWRGLHPSPLEWGEIHSYCAGFEAVLGLIGDRLPEALAEELWR